jgi:hypothetical protein
MTINLKIEIIKIFSLELNFSSDKSSKKDEADEKDSSAEPTGDEPAGASK